MISLQASATRVSDTEDREKVASLLGFAGAILRAREPVALALEPGLGIFHEDRLAGLPGVRINVDEETWLRVERQRESRPKAPPEAAAPFVTGRIDDPLKRPVIAPSISQTLDINEAKDLIERELVRLESLTYLDPLPEGADGEPDDDAYEGLVSVVRHLEDDAAAKDAISAWLEGPWARWAEAEKPIRQAILLYNDLYKLHSAMHTADANPLELVWGIGLARWRHPGGVVDMPILEQRVDIELEEGGTIVVRPRMVPPALVLAPYLHLNVTGSDRLLRKLQGDLATILEGDGEFSPFVTVWEPLLMAAAAGLSADAVHVSREELADGAKLLPPSDMLRIVSSWVIFGRRKSNEARSQDLAALQAEVLKSGMDKAPALRGYASPEPDAPAESMSGFGLSSALLAGEPAGGSWAEPSRAPRDPGAAVQKAASPGAARKAHFFPLPYNEEQAKITDLLEKNDVVSVTGPPGTGKTHTIANIVSHYMALGKRTLVTARTPEAIAAVREKLPEGLRALAISSVGSDRESAKQLQEAVSRLSDEVISLDVEETEREIRRLEAEVVRCEEQAEEADRQLANLARENLAPLTWRGKNQTAMDLVLILAEEGRELSWFTDRPEREPPTDLPAILERLREALPRLAPDIAYTGVELPDPEGMPTSSELVEAHRIRRAERLRVRPDYSTAPIMARDSRDAEERALKLLDEARAIAVALESLGGAEKRIVLFCGSRPGEIDRFREISAELGKMTEHDQASTVTWSLEGIPAEEFRAAAIRGAAGQKPVRFGLFQGALKTALATVRVDDRPAESAEDWKRVVAALGLEEQRDGLAAWLSGEVQEGVIEALPETSWALAACLRDLRHEIARALAVVDRIRELRTALAPLFPYGLDLDGMEAKADMSNAIFALQANLPDDYVEPAAYRHLMEIAGDRTTELHSTLRAFAESLGTDAIDERGIIETRGELTREIQRLAELGPALRQLHLDLEALVTAGVPQWAEKLSGDPLGAPALLPGNWREAWAWAMMCARVDRIVGLGNGDDLRARKAEILKRRQRLFEELIRARTMRGLRDRMSPSVRRAMAAFAQAVGRVGKGTGKSAPRFRRIAQEEARNAAPAVPVWILPEYRIPEQLPPVLGDFDLVILDEASQSDVTALAALARGKKVLIVGDEEQVSPSPVGIKMQQVNALRAQFLQDLPNAGLIDENASIFEITQRMYPMSHVILREHFRCAPPIIQFSSRFYQNRLLPLRVPKASERFDPPLVDVFVQDATRKGNINDAEASFIVDEIARIAEDPRHEHRSIGVISLIGAEQAEMIERRLLQDPRIGPEVMTRHRIILGDARTMQGQERSIVFLSMIATPDTARAQSMRADQQRMNVAMSRAADRLYLVRSVEASDLKPTDIKAQVLAHFLNPMPEGRAHASDDLLDRCESGFEREVLGLLLDAGYRARPQVKAGAFSIDIVIEGAGDRRLAVELDGDAYHGPDVWERDMVRQAALERAGWVFWRVFGSQWNAARDYWWRHLRDTLARMEIEPIGVEALDERFTEFRIVEPFDATAEDDDEAVVEDSSIRGSEEDAEVATRTASSSERFAPDSQGQLPL